ncbi:uncharacterized protein [Ptychodera flava]
MFDILDKYDKSENDVIRRYLSTMDLYKEDDKTTAGGKGNTQELDKTLEATCVDETARETCALVKNLLCNFAEMTAKEIKDALDVINKIIMETSKERRMVIAERIAGVDGFLESLMNLALNFYGNGDEDLYFDELRWQNLNSVNSIFWNCADASIQFASAAGDAGLVKFLLHICQQHREKLKDKNTILLDLISEFYGGLPENLKPLLDKSQMTELQEEEVRDNTDDTERRTQFDCPICSAQASEDQDHLHFLAVSDRSGMKRGGRVAYRIDSERCVSPLDKAVFVTDKPLVTGRPFEIQIDKIDPESTAGSLDFGVTIYKDLPNDVYQKEDCGESSGIWFLRDCIRKKDFKHCEGKYNLNLAFISEGDRIAIIQLPNKTLRYYYNGKDQGIAFRNIPEDVYPLIAVTGRCLQISIVDKLSNINVPSGFSEPCEQPDLEGEESYLILTGLEEAEAFHRVKIRMVIDEGDDQQANLYAAVDDYFNFSWLHDSNRDIAKRVNQERSGEADTLTLLSNFAYYALTLNQSIMRIDPISKTVIKDLNGLIRCNGQVLLIWERENVNTKEPNKLTGRLAEIFKYILKPCFNNLKSVDGYVWTGSTSEGFAITDHSAGTTRYFIDEMDLMIPVAMVTEAADSDLRAIVTDGVEITNQYASCSSVDIDVSGAWSFLPWSRKRGLESLVSKLERIGFPEKQKGNPHLEWVNASQPGYVYIHLRRDKTEVFTKEFVNRLCTTFSSDTGQEDHFLSRSKLLKIQGDYVRSRLPAVQSKIDKTSRKYAGIDRTAGTGGRVELLQQGPVQTISVFYEATSEDGKTMAEFEQTVDCALALVCKEWPSIAKKWETRDRKWPASDVINAIIVAGCHVVPKSYPGEGGDECLQWRLSFSLAERTLAHTFTEKQRMFYLVVKKIWRMYLKEPKVLSSYHMKTTMFWVSEQTPAEKWTEFHLADRFLDFFDQLGSFLEQGNVPNFFLPENNMVSHIPESEIREVLLKVRDVRKRPDVYMQDISLQDNSFHVTRKPLR